MSSAPSARLRFSSRFVWRLACLLMAVLPWAAGPAHAKPPVNVVLIISDDQAWTDYGFMGHPLVKTPHIDRLASEGLCFPRGYVPASLCCPSLASIITGKYPHVHRVTGNDPVCPPDMPRPRFYQSAAFREGREVMNANLAKHPLLPKVLADKGYLSLQTGKWWQGHFRNGGFTHGMTRGGRHGDDGLDIGRKTLQPIAEFIDDARRQEKPFFVWYAPLLPHDPHTPPDRLLRKYRDKVPSIHVARYLAMVEWFDETVGDLLKLLDDRGLTRDTLVAYVTDNGWIQDPESPRYAPRSKQSPFDGGLRTPILLRWPGTLPARRDETPVSSLDLFPTLLRAAGIQPPPDLPGVDLTDQAAVAGRKEIFGECHRHDLKDLNDPAKNLRWRWVIQDGWKLILPHAPNEPDERPALYRISNDPHERTNLAEKESARVSQLTGLLDAWWRP